MSEEPTEVEPDDDGMGAIDVADDGIAPGSILAEIKERAQELREEREPWDTPIPGYNRKLWVRFDAVPIEELREIGKNVDKLQKHSTNPELLGAIDCLIRACLGMYVKDPKHEMAEEVTGLVPLYAYPELQTDVPVKFDVRLASYLALEAGDPPRARQIVRQLFKNDYAIMAMYADLMEWQGDTDASVTKDLLGE